MKAKCFGGIVLGTVIGTIVLWDLAKAGDSVPGQSIQPPIPPPSIGLPISAPQVMPLPTLYMYGGRSPASYFPSDLNDSYNWLYFETDVAAQLYQKPDVVGSNCRIIPFTDAIFPIGSILIGMSPPTSDCQFSTNVIDYIQIAPWPVMTESNSYVFRSSIPSEWRDIIENVPIYLESTNNVYYVKYSNLKEAFISNGDLKRGLANSVCFASVLDFTNEEISVIRGQITGTIEISSSESFRIGGDLTQTNILGLRVQYNTNGDFDIEETSPVALFNIVSDVVPAEFNLYLKDTDIYRMAAENTCAPSNQNSFTILVDGETKDIGVLAAEAKNGNKPDNHIHNVTLTTFDILIPTLERISELGQIPNSSPQ